eukprot:TRINITY_DN2389_c0_g2_i1.p1 TRINITY_DN2389_c0_g2~~TRINITY_DN2389_c0_g2_i1.p1  ORF type:complete len:108 (+),score=14.51 TRINITY_DN2389_c0_g2_i1:300-623(+)
MKARQNYKDPPFLFPFAPLSSRLAHHFLDVLEAEVLNLSWKLKCLKLSWKLQRRASLERATRQEEEGRKGPEDGTTFLGGGEKARREASRPRVHIFGRRSQYKQSKA